MAAITIAATGKEAKKKKETSPEITGRNYFDPGGLMISLKQLIKRDTLNDQGARLGKIVTEKLINSDDVYEIDFAGVSPLSPLFFQDFIFQLVIEFGSDVIEKRLQLFNLTDQHRAAYRAACDQSSAYRDQLSARHRSVFGDISDLTLELLIKVRELSRNDPASAQVIFGINSDMIASLVQMNMELVRRIANAGVICFEPRLSPEFAAKMAILKASEIDVFLNSVGGLEGVYESQFD
jgi:2-succinyl-5-enolpyruvyl-6-hydroxy-3-cyclohexene-1-carboxylate synthase